MLDTLQNLMPPALPPLEALIACALAAVALSFILAGSCGAFFALAAEWLALRTKRAFHARAARQIAQMTLVSGLIAAIIVGCALGWTVTDNATLLADPYRLPLALAGGSVALALGLLALYSRIRPDKGLAGVTHMLIGLAAGICAAFALFCGTGVVRRLLHSPPDWDISLSLPSQLVLFFRIPAESFFWPLLFECIPLGLASAAAFACIWLLLVREKQDYGRDYYAFALPFCATWAACFTLLAVLAGAFVLYESRRLMLPELSHAPSLLLDALSAALPLLGCVLWLFIARSAHPMRRKISVIAACLLLLAGFAGQVLMLNTIVPSP